MEELASKVSEKESIPQESDDDSKSFTNGKSNSNSSLNLFPESPVYEPDEDLKDANVITISSDERTQEPLVKDPLHAKRKLSNEMLENHPKILRIDSLEEFKITSQNLDDEVSSITAESKVKRKDLVLPSSSHVRSPARPSPRKITKRSNSTEVTTPKTPTTKTKSRPASTDIIRERKTPRKIEKNLFQALGPVVEISSDDSNSRSSIGLKEKSTQNATQFTLIAEENASELYDSQNFHLVLSPTPEEDSEEVKTNNISTSDPVVVKDRKEILDPAKINQTRSEGYNYSDQSSNLSQIFKVCDYGKTTDQESTDSVHSISIDSPDHMPTVASKMISKLSNGNSSTPTEQSLGNKHITISDNDSELTPDMLKQNGNKDKGKNESFRVSNQTTPSTISPMQNGHSLPMNSNINTPHIPTFDIHVSHNEDGEFLSLYIVKTDSDLGMDMYKEYQRISKRFTIDPYLGDVSHASTSPSSVTSTGMINLPNRTSYASTTSSTSTSSNRTSDGAFVVPQPPRKSVSHPSSTSVKGRDALLKKIQDILSHLPDHSMDLNRSVEDKISIGIQASPSSEAASLSNGNASPMEVSKCDKATPKSSLKKTKVRGRRPLSTKTKRAILPTQAEEPEYMQGMNSPEMLPNNSENGKMSPKSLKDEKPLSSLVATPKSVNKLKQKRSRPTSPRPATPVEKSLLKQDYQGFPPNTVVLAKWVDKRYYSGRVVEMTEPNKYLIKFDDGQSKSLLDDFIIFGDSKALPLGGQSVYAMVDDQQTFEPGLVLEVDENSSGTVTYRCTTDGDTTVSVTASELYLTEDQARSIKESRAKSPHSAPATPRRRGLRELDLDNIIQGPRSARSRDKGSSSGRKRVHSPKSPKASTSGLKSAKWTPLGRRRLASESSELSESSNSAPPARLEEVAGVEPEVQKTPRKIDGVKAGPLQLKGATKQNIGKKNSKLAKFSDDADTISQLGPIPVGSGLFAGLAFLLTCTEPPSRQRHSTEKEARHYSSEEDGETSTSMAGTDTEDLEFSDKPFNKERLKDQLEAGGGTVYSHFDDVPKNKYSVCKLIAPRPCLTAKYIQCLASAIRCVSHAWVVACCAAGARLDADAFALPAGWAVLARRFVNWTPPTGKRNTSFYNNKVILLCGDQDTFVKFWERVCTLAGANTRVVNEEDLNMADAIALVTEFDCPHEVQNKANQDNVPLVSTTWVVQCLIEGKILPPTSHDKFSFMYTEPE